MNVKELKELLEEFPEHYEVLIPVDINHGFACSIIDIEYTDYDEIKNKGYGMYNQMDGLGDMIQRNAANAILINPEIKLLFSEQKLPYPWDKNKSNKELLWNITA